MSENTEQLTSNVQVSEDWMETFTSMAQGALPSARFCPPECSGKCAAEFFKPWRSPGEYLRSPQFMEATKQWMDSAIFYRR